MAGMTMPVDLEDLLWIDNFGGVTSEYPLCNMGYEDTVIVSGEDVFSCFRQWSYTRGKLYGGF